MFAQKDIFSQLCSKEQEVQKLENHAMSITEELESEGAEGLTAYYNKQISAADEQFDVQKSKKNKESAIEAEQSENQLLLNDGDVPNEKQVNSNFKKKDFDAQRIENDIKNLQDMALAISRQGRTQNPARKPSGFDGVSDKSLEPYENGMVSKIIQQTNENQKAASRLNSMATNAGNNNVKSESEQRTSSMRIDMGQSQSSMGDNSITQKKTRALQMVDQESKEYEEKKKKMQMEKKKQLERNLQELDEPKNQRSCANCRIF